MAMALPNVNIMATCVAMAGAGQSNYEAGKVAIETLIAAVPQMKNMADVQGEQVVKIGSQDMNDEVWLKLAKRVNELLAKDDVDGIVITYGTDTMEEIAYFFNLSVKSDKLPQVGIVYSYANATDLADVGCHIVSAGVVITTSSTPCSILWPRRARTASG